MNDYSLYKENKILVDKDIIELSNELSLISPIEISNLSGCAYDIRVGSILKSRNKEKSFDLSKSESYNIESGECVTIDTFEKFNLRNIILFAYIYNKHSILAKGLFHPITTIDPGFVGPLALTFFNLGNIPYEIKYKDKIASVCFHTLNALPVNIYGVTQPPSYREGNPEIALLIEKPHEESKEEDLLKMYGKPIELLFEKTKKLEERIHFTELEIESKKNKRIIAALWGLILALLSGFSGSLLTIYWNDIKKFINGI